ncbi:replication terminator protein [Lactobacillus rhamnosus]|uniref:Replication terminator protein n=1 Tax=Lacticaseibacillus rhamnosus TaxID=47715 RepID=A0A7Y7QHP5_LACRH|nr:replication terminator protein [Lacticaseibacillus rhamnosus]NVO88920.1 replication terminator protein [Lacticaseibacillus rhamnosus]
MKQLKLDLNALADGAIKEKLAKALERIGNNILDPNTDPKKVRKATINLSFKPNGEGVVSLKSEVKTTLAPDVSVDTTLLIGRGDDGFPVMNELKSGAKGQEYFDPDDSTLKHDDGEPVESENKNEGPIDFRKIKDAKEAK